jgi:curved DNA-binding protein CbpA
MTTLYEILDANETATPEEIKDAYRVMAMKWHPDRNLNNRSQAEAKFKEIGAAYKALYDPVQRKDYDEWLANERKQSSQHSYTKTEDMSDKDADNIFFESMLDLAIEIAKRGYVEEVIVKALLALDCPESVANAVAKKAFNSAEYKRDNSATEGSEKYPNGMDSIEGFAWNELEPYYTAAISGEYANDRMSEGEYLYRLGRDKKQTKGFLISFALMFAGLLTTIINH